MSEDIVARLIGLIGAEPAAVDADRARTLIAQHALLSQAAGDAPTVPQPCLVNLPSALASRASAGPDGSQQIGGVVVIPLRGILTPNSAFATWMGWSTYHGIEAAARAAMNAEDVEAVVIDADSPGGLVNGCEAATVAVAALAAVKPVLVTVNPLAASAAYWIVSQATEISLTHGAEVGSIGVMAQAYQPVQPDIMGDQWAIVTSTHARGKRPDHTTPEGRAELQRLCDEVEERFHAAVAAGRGTTVERFRAAVSTTADLRDGGACFTGQDAIARGLADRVEAREDFYARILSTYPGERQTAAPSVNRARGFAARAAAARARAAI